MNRRFFVPDPIRSDRTTLSGAEAHHLHHVLRARVGDELILFDGSGREFPARVIQLQRAAVVVAIGTPREVDRECPMRIVLGATLPKGERQRWLVEKLVELGVAAFVPLTTVRSVAVARPGTLDKLERAVIEASKQCGRNRLMQIETPLTLEQFLPRPPAGAVRWLADPGGTPLVAELQDTGAADVWLAVGPEGGFLAAERDAARDLGWHLVSLGPRILRVETAALLLVSRAHGGR